MEELSMEPGTFNYTTEDEERILGNIEGDATFLKIPSATEMRNKYINDCKRLISSQLHLTTLGQYLKERKIPRGLRSNIRPNLFSSNTTFRNRFMMISNKYAMDVMLLNVEFLQIEVKKLQTSVGDTGKKLQDLLNKDDWTVFKDKVDKDMSKIRGELEETKRKKWIRDTGDYETGHVYAWQTDNFKTTWRKRGYMNVNSCNVSNLYDMNYEFVSFRLNQRSSRKKRRGGRRQHRRQKENRKKQSTENTEPTEERTELVVNISHKILTGAQISVLSKGLNFSPCTHINWFQLQIDLERFLRQIKLREWFGDNKDISSEKLSEFDLRMVDLKNKSKFIPPTSSAVIKAFEEAVKLDIEQLRCKGVKEYKRPNILREEMEALEELVHDGDIIIKPADKGGAVVVMDKQAYVTEVMKQLSDEQVYGKLERDPKFSIQEEIKKCLEEALHACIINQELYNYLFEVNPRTPVLYITPKIHKTLVDPPGRPIVSGVGSVFNKMGIFLDKILNSITRKKAIHLENRVLLASFDVVLLYTSINHDGGLRAINRMLDARQYTPEGKSFLLTMLEIILRRNYFLFGDAFYTQKQGTAMGANMAPSYANLVMEVLEEDLVYVSHHFRYVLGWWRYIDDVFLLWTGTETELDEFHSYLNTVDLTIKFTLVKSWTEIQFLDVLVEQKNGQLITTLYVKDTDRNNLLLYDSQHPCSMKRSIPLSQLLRVRRIVRDEDTVDTTIDQLIKKFLNRGYPKRLLEQTKKKVMEKDRLQLICRESYGRNKRTLNRVPFVSTYSEESREISNIIKKHWTMLGRCLPNVPEFKMPPLYSYKRSRNIKDIIIRSDIGPKRKDTQRYLTGSKRNGCFPCLNCINCTYMVKGPTFVHPKTGKHFADCKYTEKDLKCKIIDAVPIQRRGGNRELILKKKELMWINELNTLRPGGLNADFKMHTII
ncbi:unnamed protein product [Ranitomeya imitator]|uniref:Reverse transcriptase domain-containing protein n=1 Tax=Ranitomeya imitator TaxID=111125 RepID=A0ABN9MH90_9NEOB|nr:unnamed protein product [Ranitomeya imitator]